MSVLLRAFKVKPQFDFCSHFGENTSILCQTIIRDVVSTALSFAVKLISCLNCYYIV